MKGLNHNRIEEEYDIENNIPIDITDSVTHSEFVNNVESGNIFYVYNGFEACKICDKTGRFYFAALWIMYAVAPVLIVPAVGYHYNNWWLLFV